MSYWLPWEERLRTFHFYFHGSLAKELPAPFGQEAREEADSGNGEAGHSYQMEVRAGMFGKATSEAAVGTGKQVRKSRPALPSCGLITLAEQWREVTN